MRKACTFFFESFERKKQYLYKGPGLEGRKMNVYMEGYKS